MHQRPGVDVRRHGGELLERAVLDRCGVSLARSDVRGDGGHMSLKPTSHCLCGSPIPSFAFRIPDEQKRLAERFFAIAELICECPNCGRTWERPLSDGSIVATLGEALDWKTS